jgi:outer membrane protein TolC
MKSLFRIIILLLSYLNITSQELNSKALFEYAKANSPQLKNASLDVFLSDEKIKEIKSTGLPKINGELSFQNFINVPTTVVGANTFDPTASPDELIGLAFGTPFNANYSLQASQLIFSFSYLYAVKAAKNLNELARLSLVQKHETLFESIQLNLGQVILIKKQKKLVLENIKELDSLKKKTNSLIANGLLEKTAINDLIVMELDLKNGVEQLNSNHELALLSLKSKIGYPLDSNIYLTENFELDNDINSISPNKLNPKSSRAVQLGEQSVLLSELDLKATKSEGYPSIFGFFNQQHMAMRNSFDFFDANKNWYPSTLWGINVKIPIYNSGEGAAKNKQKELELLKAKNELVDIESQIISLFTLLKNNYQNALSSFKDQKTKVDLVENVYFNEEKKLSHGASNSLTISQRKMQLLQTKQALIQKEYELYKSEVQLKTHTNPIQL